MVLVHAAVMLSFTMRWAWRSFSPEGDGSMILNAAPDRHAEVLRDFEWTEEEFKQKVNSPSSPGKGFVYFNGFLCE